MYFFLIVACSLFFLWLTNPLPMSFILILLAMSLGLAGSLFLSKWLGLAFIMIFVGGMMVIFLYVSSLSFNQKFFFVTNALLVSLVSLLISKLVTLESLKSMVTPEYFFSQVNMNTLLFLIGYLLLSMLIAVKFAESFKGALVQKF